MANGFNRGGYSGMANAVLGQKKPAANQYQQIPQTQNSQPNLYGGNRNTTSAPASAMGGTNNPYIGNNSTNNSSTMGQSLNGGIQNISGAFNPAQQGNVGNFGFNSNVAKDNMAVGGVKGAIGNIGYMQDDIAKRYAEQQRTAEDEWRRQQLQLRALAARDMRAKYSQLASGGANFGGAQYSNDIMAQGFQSQNQYENARGGYDAITNNLRADEEEKRAEIQRSKNTQDLTYAGL